MSYTESEERIAGCKVRLMRGGKGAPLLFLHGSSGASSWLPFMEALSQNHEVFVFEHPGFGRSENPTWLDTMSDLAFFYLDAIEHLGLSDISLVGASIGGWLAAEIAIRDCRSLASLTLVAPAGIHVKGLRKGDIFMWSPQETARNLFFAQSFAEKMLAAPVTPEAQMEILQNRLTTAKLAWQPRFYNPDLYKWLHRIKVQTLIVWGENDKVIPAGYGPAFRDLIPGARLEVIAECGHLPQVEKMEEFVGLVGGFIREVAR
ncbi:alpha/beta hydrolase [Chelativorans sp.]|uniref:alpha/beta fold hydrolase n=1 Tax=Chelativorans sp. TaxID=2203393 RepID=UPI002811A5C0|nr:alpha/beta hydrolase [Chelativorans sp.]